MNEFRFSCGKCGQHLKAEVDCGNVVIECPLCSTRIRVPEPGQPGEALPVARETTALVTPLRSPDAAPVARVAAPAPPPVGPPSTLESPPEEAPAEVARKRNGSPALVAAAVAIPLLAAAAALWFWQPWREKQTVLPPPPSRNTQPPPPAAQTASVPPATNPVAAPATSAPSLPQTNARSSQSPARAVKPEAPAEPAPQGASPAPPQAAETKTPDPIAAFVASWEVNFGAQPRDARAVIEAQLDPLGLSVSPSIYTAASGRHVNLPPRRGTRLELLETVGRQIGWKPVYTERQLKFERGLRKEPAAFAGPFMLEITHLWPSSIWGTEKLSLRVTGVGIPDSLRQRWAKAPLRLTNIQALTPEGADLYDQGAEVEYRLLASRGGLLVFEQEISLCGVYRGVTRLAVLRAALEPPGLKPPARRLQFELRDLPLKPGPDTPAGARPLVFEGAAPVSVKVISTLAGYPFYRARVAVRNEADRPLRAVTLRLLYLNAAGETIGTARYTQKGSATLPGPHERRVLERVPLRDRPENTERVAALVTEARFIDGTHWKRALEDKPR